MNLSLFIMSIVDILKDSNPSIYQVHFISWVCFLAVRFRLLFINRGLQYLNILTTNEFISIVFVLISRYINMPFSTFSLKLTLDIIWLTIAWLVRPAVMYTPKAFILLTCSTVYSLVTNLISLVPSLI